MQYSMLDLSSTRKYVHCNVENKQICLSVGLVCQVDNNVYYYVVNNALKYHEGVSPMDFVKLYNWFVYFRVLGIFLEPLNTINGWLLTKIEYIVIQQTYYN